MRSSKDRNTSATYWRLYRTELWQLLVPFCVGNLWDKRAGSSWTFCSVCFTSAATFFFRSCTFLCWKYLKLMFPPANLCNSHFIAFLCNSSVIRLSSVCVCFFSQRASCCIAFCTVISRDEMVLSNMPLWLFTYVPLLRRNIGIQVGGWLFMYPTRVIF